jgi:replicative DNA helicase
MSKQVDELFSKSAEAAVLGSMVLDSNCISKVVSYLPSEAF